jgi:hypothetical protein
VATFPCTRTSRSPESSPYVCGGPAPGSVTPARDEPVPCSR